MKRKTTTTSKGKAVKLAGAPTGTTDFNCQDVVVPAGSRYDGTLPEELSGFFHRSMADNDEELQSLRREIALADAMIERLTNAAKTEGAFSDRERKELVSAVNLLDRALSSRDGKRAGEATRRLRELAASAGDVRGISEELRSWVEQRRKLVDSEAKRLQLLANFVPVDRVNLWLGFVIALVGQRVSDRAVARNLIDDILRLSGKQPLSEYPPALLPTPAVEAED